MTETHHNAHPAHPADDADGATAAEPEGFANPLVLGMTAYVIFPILALITAVMGFILVLNDNVVAGVIFLAVIMQLWVAGGLWTHMARKKALAKTS